MMSAALARWAARSAPADDEGVAPVGGHRDGLALGPHRAVDDLAADDQRLGVGEEGLDVGRTAHLEGSLEILCVRHGRSPSGGCGFARQGFSSESASAQAHATRSGAHRPSGPMRCVEAGVETHDSGRRRSASRTYVLTPSSSSADLPQRAAPRERAFDHARRRRSRPQAGTPVAPWVDVVRSRAPVTRRGQYAAVRQVAPPTCATSSVERVRRACAAPGQVHGSRAASYPPASLRSGAVAVRASDLQRYVRTCDPTSGPANIAWAARTHASTPQPCLRETCVRRSQLAHVADVHRRRERARRARSRSGDEDGRSLLLQIAMDDCVTHARSAADSRASAHGEEAAAAASMALGGTRSHEFFGPSMVGGDAAPACLRDAAWLRGLKRVASQCL